MRRLLLALADEALIVPAVHPLCAAVGYALRGHVHSLRAQLRGRGTAGALVLVG